MLYIFFDRSMPFYYEDNGQTVDFTYVYDDSLIVPDEQEESTLASLAEDTAVSNVVVQHVPDEIHYSI